MSSDRLDSTDTLPHTDPDIMRAELRERLGERKPFLVVLQGDDVGLRYRIEGSCVLGRDPSCDVLLHDARASGRHAQFEIKDDEVHVADLASTNGTLVNDERIDESRLQAGDKIVIGTTVLRLDWLDALEQDFHEELERLLSIDELTGLLQKRRFDTEGSALVGTTLGSGASVSVLMMDLDGIKKINDAHGHAFGAYCIAESGALIGQVIGARGIATRWGGDEYSAILPGADDASGFAVAEEILAAIRAHVFEREHVRLRPGVSIGVATGPRQGKTLEALQRRADEALYRAKRAGKGQVSA